MRGSTLRSARALAAVVMLMSILSCGDDPGAQPVRGSSGGWDDLGAVAEAIAAGGAVSVAANPEGGAVLVGAATPSGGGQRFSPEGVVVDAAGKVTSRFVLPEPLLERATVVVGGTAFVVGVPCRGVASEDDETGRWDCSPGGIVGHRVDLATGSVESLDLPADLVASGSLMASLPLALYRSGDDVVLIAATSGPEALRAWRRASEGGWTPVEAPGSLPCQVGDHLVEDLLPGASGNIDPEVTEAVRPAVRTFDDATGQWSAPIAAEPLVGVADLPPTAVCGATRAVAVPLGDDEQVRQFSSFSPEARAWETLELPSTGGVAAPIGVDGLTRVILYPIAGDRTRSALALDPETGAAVEVPLDLERDVTFVPLTPDLVLLFRSDGTHDTVRIAE